MFRHILVPLDLTDRNRRLLAVALALAQQASARVTLLHVVQRIEKVPQGELRAFYQRLTQASQRELERVAAPFERRGVAVHRMVRVGRPPTEIVRAASGRGADLIVMGSHRVTPGRPGAGWGTTSYKVGLFCECSVLLVK
jgi:nucleotide-binding universal stress UspA family protein